MAAGGGSGALDCYLDAGRGGLPRPLYFHHIRKTGGSSFRAGVTRALDARGLESISVPAVKERLRAEGRWPGGLGEIVASLSKVQAVLSHYTALIDLPGVLTLIRDPEALFWSQASFVQRRPGTTPKAIARRIANAQIRSLTGVDVPPWEPEDATPWLPLVDQALGRFTIFRLDRFDQLLAHCRTAYGLEIEPLHKKPGRQILADDFRRGIAAEFDRRNPVWLDRLLYERAAAIA